MKNENPEKRQNRSLDLIANFIDGYAEGWHFAVGKCFSDQLDIKFTDRVVNGKKTKRWTQGKLFCFVEGYVIYDTPEGYLQWSEALKHIKLRCFVIRGVPNRLDDKGNLVNGSVFFKISEPNKNKDGLETIGQYNLTQNDFVTFLKTGVLATKGY